MSLNRYHFSRLYGMANWLSSWPLGDECDGGDVTAVILTFSEPSPRKQEERTAHWF